MSSIPNNNDSNSDNPTPGTSTQNNEANTSSASSSRAQNSNVNLSRQYLTRETGASTSTAARTSSAGSDDEVLSASTIRHTIRPLRRPRNLFNYSKSVNASTLQNALMAVQGNALTTQRKALTAQRNALTAVQLNAVVDYEINRQIHLPLPVHNSVSANLPLPPDWNEHMEDVSKSLAAFKLFPIPSMACEFRKLAQLLLPLHVTGMDQIVNPTVWTRFVNAREAMLKAKCDDATVLSTLGLNDEEIAKRQQSLNFIRHNAIDAAPYNDNFVLLFHCTKNKGSIESILRDGFDERVALGGLLGRGIYFSDDALKSSMYDGCGGVIFICGVLLGDCITDYKNTISLTREPGKLPPERRNINDNFFDAVHRASTLNEYAVYNRCQCYPMYKVTYYKKYDLSLQNIDGRYGTRPPFVWRPGAPSSDSMINCTWKLHAKSIFDDIASMQLVESDDYYSNSLTPIDEMLAVLISLGFGDTKLNLKTLLLNDFSVERTVNALSKQSFTIKFGNVLTTSENVETTTENVVATTENVVATTENLWTVSENASETESELSSFSQSTDEDEPPPVRRRLTEAETSKKSSPPSASLEEECTICYNNYSNATENWRALVQCQHKLCVNCYGKIELTRTTMTGESVTFMKCPFCLKTNGIEVGNCPNGQMSVVTIPTHCAGYEDYGTIKFSYTVNGLSRVAYMPANEEGQKVFNLLRIAWNRRLIFTFGTSHTTGCENALVWNIHHKTSQMGGVVCHGYPDATYLARVTAELKSFGIE